MQLVRCVHEKPPALNLDCLLLACLPPEESETLDDAIVLCNQTELFLEGLVHCSASNRKDEQRSYLENVENNQDKQLSLNIGLAGNVFTVFLQLSLLLQYLYMHD